MIDIVVSAVGLGLVINFIFGEFFGLAAGGMVVPGYVALFLDTPLDLLLTLIVSLMSFLSIKFLSNFMFIYSRRLFMFSILFGFLFGWFAKYFIVGQISTNLNLEMQSIGMIIPGLIAYWMHKQGILETISMLVIASVSIRLILILITGGEIFI